PNDNPAGQTQTSLLGGQQQQQPNDADQQPTDTPAVTTAPENIDGYQYSKLGILPSALILSIMYSDIEEENLDTIAKFLSEPFSSDKQMKLEDNKIDSTISISKDIKKQIITLVIE
ncbi:MAG: hypothetical protein RR531_02885, partial [Longicatena sp.]